MVVSRLSEGFVVAAGTFGGIETPERADVDVKAKSFGRWLSATLFYVAIGNAGGDPIEDCLELLRSESGKG